MREAIHDVAAQIRCGVRGYGLVVQAVLVRPRSCPPDGDEMETEALNLPRISPVKMKKPALGAGFQVVVPRGIEPLLPP